VSGHRGYRTGADLAVLNVQLRDFSGFDGTTEGIGSDLETF
jgi:hypothetical protein